ERTPAIVEREAEGVGMLVRRTTGSLSYAAASEEAWPPALAVREVGPAAAPKPRPLDRVREAIRARHYSRRTAKTYVACIRRYSFFHGKRHPAEMGSPEITRFLTLPHLPALLRHLSAGRCARHPNGPGALGPHHDVSTTMIYTHVLNPGPGAVRSPADRVFPA